MSLNLKKVSAIAASALMIGMTAGVAAASNYPAPFVSGGSSSVAIVYGTGSGVSSLDLVQAGNIQSSLQSYMAGSSDTTTEVTGEAAALFSGGDKLYLGDKINSVVDSLSSSKLPTVLADGTFSGADDVDYTQTIQVGGYPSVSFAQQPTDDDDPNLAIALSDDTDNAAFNLTIRFDDAVNFTDEDSVGEDIVLFGQDYTIGSETDEDNLVLLQSAEKIDLSSDSSTTDITLGGVEYTIELVSVDEHDDADQASVRVTNKATGTSATKDIDEGTTKKVNGIAIGVTSASSNSLKYAASVIAGSEKIVFTEGDAVKVGEDEEDLDGTLVSMYGGNAGALTKMTISVTTDDDDEDAIQVGGELLDPVFKTVKLSLGGFNIATDSTAREEISVANSGDDKMKVTFTNYDGDDASVNYVDYSTGTATLLSEDGEHIHVQEGAVISEDDWVMVGNEDEGHLLQLTKLEVDSDGKDSDDTVTFKDAFTNTGTNVVWDSAGIGTLTLGGTEYDVVVEDNTNSTLTIDDADSSSTKTILYNTIETSNGGLVGFYEPVNLTIDSSNDDIMIPDGDEYATLDVTYANASAISYSCGTATKLLNGTGSTISATCTIPNTGLVYNTSLTADNVLSVKLQSDGANLEEPAIVFFEDQDEDDNYGGAIISTSAYSSTDEVEVDSIYRTIDASATMISLETDDDLSQNMDHFGTLYTKDDSATQATATISYPEEQVYALVYIGEEGSSIGVSGASAGTALGDILVKDTEVSSVESKNLVVVGGSCINSVAANLIGSSACGADFTTETGIGSGQFLIQSFGDAYTTGKIALLVAGYDAADTVNAATYLRTQTVDTTAGKKYEGTSATTATLVTTSE